jgi:hypothetical protein
MLSNTVKIIAAIIVLMAFLGCTQNRNVFMGESQLDKNWGRAYETAKHSQIINHDAGKNTDPVEEFDGQAAERTMENYRSGDSSKQESRPEFGVVTIKQ